jgi:hypothetical protein
MHKKFSVQNLWISLADSLLRPAALLTILYCICMWSSSQSSWLPIQRSEFDSWRYQIFWEVVGLERGPFSTTEELLGRNSSGSGLESRDYGRKDPSRWPRDILYPQIWH